jgi:hypothetical protein
MTMPSRFEWKQDNATQASGFDPYGEWSTGHGRAYDLTELEQRLHPQDFNYAVEFRSFTGKPKPKPVADEVFRFNDTGGSGVHTFNLTNLNDEPSGSPDKCLKLRAPLRHRSINPQAKSPPGNYDAPAGLDPASAVIIGCIDDGINIAHDRFRIENEDGSFASRVDFAWIQDGEAVAAKRKPAFGREWLRQEIEEAINASNGDEETVLKRLQLVDFTSPGSRSLARRLTHGTGVLDVATGTASGDGAADAVNQRIVSVQLPALVTMETSGALLNLFLLAGLHYILERARLISKHVSPAAPLPVIINFSFGIAGGPHDGRHFIERAFQALIEDHKDSKFGGDVHVVIPSGNLFLTRGHAAVTSSTSSSATVVQLPWRVQPDDHTSSYLEIWLPDSTTDPQDLEVSVQAPGQSQPVNVLTGGNVSQPMILENPESGAAIARLSVDRPVEPGRWRVLLALAATASTDPSVVVAPSGVWQVTLSATIPQGQMVNAWIQRDNAPVGYTTPARQSWFDDAGYDRFDQAGDWQLEDNASPVRRFGTLNGIATAEHLVVIGAYQLRDGNQSLYSSAADGETMRTPDASAIADTSRHLPGILAAGARSGSTFALSGTSVATPHAARWIAGEIAKPASRSGFDAAAFIRNLAVQHENTLPPGEVAALQQERSGHGRLPLHPSLAWSGTRGS